MKTKTIAMKRPTPAIVIRNARIASSSEDYAFAMMDALAPSQWPLPDPSRVVM